LSAHEREIASDVAERKSNAEVPESASPLASAEWYACRAPRRSNRDRGWAFPSRMAQYNHVQEASMSTLSPEQRHAIESNGHVAIDDGAYVVVTAAAYERLRSLVVAGPLSIDEQKAMITQIGKKVGWDDPRMDVYNDLDPRRKP
jgi:hypothetical protein